MGKMREPRFKISRRLGVNVFGHPKAMKRAESSNQRKKKISNYGMQLLQKQKLRTYYGVMEKQFRRYVNRAMKSRDLTGDVLLKILECRLDNIVYRIGFANSIRQARQMVNHGHILVNNKKVNIASYEVMVGDEIKLRSKYTKNQMFHANFLELNKFELPYIEKDYEEFSGKLIRMPEKIEIPIQVNEVAVVEFYTK